MQSEGHSSGAGLGPGGEDRGAVPPGRKEGIHHIHVLEWLPSPAAMWGMHGETARSCWKLRTEQGWGAAQDSEEEHGRGGWSTGAPGRTVGHTGGGSSGRPLPWSTQCPRLAGRVQLRTPSVASLERRDRVPGAPCPVPAAPSLHRAVSLAGKVGVQEWPAPPPTGASGPESFLSPGLPSIPRLGRW